MVLVFYKVLEEKHLKHTLTYMVLSDELYSVFYLKGMKGEQGPRGDPVRNVILIKSSIYFPLLN